MKFFKQSSILIGILLAFILVHFGLMKFILGVEKYYFIPIYSFVLIVLLVTILIVQFLELKFREHLGYFFLVIVALKLIAAKIFMNNFAEWKENAFKFSFLVLYLVSLILITWFVAKKLLREER